MKKLQDKTTHFFVDESGDPTFYDAKGNLIVGKEGASKILLLGFIKTDNSVTIRKELEKLRKDLSEDKYLQGIPSLLKSLSSFHAKDDSPEVKQAVYKTIVGLKFSAEIIVARKIQNIFNKTHHRNENEFYDDLVSKLFQNKLHTSSLNEIYFAVRGSRLRQQPLENAIKKAVESFESKWKTKVTSKINIYPQSPSGEPCLQVADYINWAVQRAIVKRDMRFYKFIEDKISYLVDIYDTDKYPKNFYNRRNKFDVDKISPL